MAIFLIATFIMPQNVFAYSKYIIAGGENIGIQINNKGVIVAGFYKIDDTYPGIDSHLQKGDIILKVDNKDISSINDFIDAIENSNQRSLKLIYKRGNDNKTTILNLKSVDGTLKTGLYIKDMVSGIGTLSFIDPNTKLYGALGHEVIDSTSGIMLEIKEGKIYTSTVTSIDKSIRGEPGSKNANVDSNNIYGNILENTKNGIFGHYTKEINKNKLYEVGEFKDIDTGKAKIITVIQGNDKKEYEINIISVNNEKENNKNILFEITDKELINKTGGIVQGMSGSPIIQNNKIIGAVTNVVVNNPKRGYGVLITSMLEEAEN